MSDYSLKADERVNRLLTFSYELIKGKNVPELLKSYQKDLESISPHDVILAFDKLVGMDLSMEEIKKGVNKILNLLYQTLNSFPSALPSPDSFPDYMIRNNHQMDLRLKELRPLNKQINENPDETDLRKRITECFSELSEMNRYYQIKENVLFPILEKYWEEARCFQIMWSMHDDIRHNINNVITLLGSNEFDLKAYNRLTGDIFFNMYAIKFREEKILIPVINETIPESEVDNMLSDSVEIGFPFIKVAKEIKTQNDNDQHSGMLDLGTGVVSPEQIALIFNHLPVDITYVDENDSVRYFSSPKKRIFPRTKSIIGRKVNNCHPPESVHVVERIVDSFRKGEKGHADFWIKMKGEVILIQYFAVRDEQGTYKGVVEVSQEVSNIIDLKGEKRLLDW